MDISQHIFISLYRNLPNAIVANIPNWNSISVEFRWNGILRPYYVIEIHPADKAIELYEMVVIEATQNGAVTRQRGDKPLEVWFYD